MSAAPTGHRHRARAALTLIVLAMPGIVVTQAPPALLVETVLNDSPAARLGIMAGDRVLSHDDTPVPTPAALEAAEENSFKQDIVLRIARGHQTLTLMAPAGPLGLQVRPELPPALLARYEEGRTAHIARKTEQAVARWTTAARAAQDAGEKTIAAWLYGRVGELREGQRQWKEAAAAHTAALDLLNQSGDRASHARTLFNLGRCSFNISDFAAAGRWNEQAEQMDAAAGNEMWVATTLTNLGYISFFRSEYAAAGDYYRRALAIRERRAPESLVLAGSLTDLGVVARLLSEFAEAEDYFRRGLAIRERLAPGSAAVSASLNNLGLLARDRGDLAIAHDYQRRALAISERLAPGSREVATILNNLGLNARDRGDLVASLDYHRRSLAISERLVPDSLAVAASLTNMGNVASASNDWAAAHEFLSRSLAINERLAPNSQTLATVLSSLGHVAAARRDLPAALGYQQRAFAIREAIAPHSLKVSASLSSLGDLARRRGDLAGARDYFSRALSIRDSLAPHSLDVASSLNSLGGVALQESRFSDALPLFTRAVDIVEARRWQAGSADARALLLAGHTGPFAGLLRTYLALNDLPAAFAIAERTRARSLLDTLAEARAEPRQGVDERLLERERTLQRQLNAQAARQAQLLDGRHTHEQAAAAKKKLDTLLLQYRELQSELRVHSPHYAALTQPQPLSLEEIQQQLLDQHTSLLEYVLGEDSSVLFAVTPTSIRAFTLPARATIEQAARRVSQLLMARQPVPGETPAERRTRIEKADADYPAAAAALAHMVLGPAVTQLAGQRLLVVADGALQYVPFGALPGSDGKPLIASHEIVNLPSASVVAIQRRELLGREPAVKQIAVVADPVFDLDDSRVEQARRSRASNAAASSLPREIQEAVRHAGLADDRGALTRLPFTRDEAEAILALSSPGRSTKALDFRASRDTVTSPALGRYRIVHLATHGLLNTENPELSGLVLSLVDEHGKPQDGFLRLHEIYNLNWSADLVVLSACQTALGKEIKGEGLVGLTRGFMYAGARGVLASLWNVNDSVTSELMKEFYRGVFVEKRPPAGALRAAQLALWKRKPFRSPYYWAAFVLQGDWR